MELSCFTVGKKNFWMSKQSPCISLKYSCVLQKTKLKRCPIQTSFSSALHDITEPCVDWNCFSILVAGETGSKERIKSKKVVSGMCPENFHFTFPFEPCPDYSSFVSISHFGNGGDSEYLKYKACFINVYASEIHSF